MSLKEDFSQRLKELRKAKGFTQASLAEAAGCSHSTIRDYENFVTFPGPDMIERLASAFGVKVVDLFSFEPVGVSSSQDQSLELIKQIASLGSVEIEILKNTLSALSKPLEAKSQKKKEA